MNSPIISKDELCQILANTLSSNDNQRKPAEERISIWKKQKYFSSILIDIISDTSSPPSLISNDIRLAACVTFKNVVIAQLNDQSVLKIISVIVSLIARSDYPSTWPNLVNFLLELFEKGNDVCKRTSLVTIKYVVNELASKRTYPLDRAIFYRFSKDLFNYFKVFWEEGSRLIINILQQREPCVTHHRTLVELFYYCSKILRRVIQYGFVEYQENEDIVAFFNILLNNLSQIVILRDKNGLNLISELVDKYIIINQKIVLRAQSQIPLSFVKFLPMTLTYFSNQIVQYNPHEKNLLLPEPLEAAFVQALLFVKSVVDSDTFQSDYLDPDTDEKQPMGSINNNSKDNVLGPIQVAQNMIKSHFNYDQLSQILKALVSNYLIINKQDLDMWEESPEEYIRHMDSEDSQTELKPCAYNLFIILMRHFHADSVSIVISMLEYVIQQVPVSDQQLLLRESCYMTIGLGYYELYDKVNFSSLFSNVFIRELQNPDNRYKIIKRRILWLMSYWAGKIPEELKVSVVQALLECINNNDIVIALTAMDALKAYIDDLEFNFEGYKPFVDMTFSSFIKLFNRTVDVETRCNLLTSLGVIFIKFLDNVKPFSRSVLELFSICWNGGQAEPMLKSSIVRCVTLFLQALNSDPTEFFEFLLPVIDHSTKPKTEESVYLLEDGLDLWFNTMVRVPTMNQILLAMFGNIVETMKQTIDYSEICLKILDTYILLGSNGFFQVYGMEVVQMIERLIGDIDEKATNMIIKPIDRILQKFPVEGAILMEPIFLKLFNILLFQEEPSNIVVVQYLAVFARLITNNTEAFFRFVDKQPLINYQSIGVFNLNQLYKAFLELWIDKTDSIGESEQRKLSAIAFCKLITVPREEMLEHIGQLITITVGMRADIDPSILSNPYCDDGTLLGDSSGVDIQSKGLLVIDPLSTIDLRSYLYQCMMESANVLGRPKFEQAISNVDKTVINLAIPNK
eukprot:gene3782-4706_t